MRFTRRLIEGVVIALIANVVWVAIPPLKVRVVDGWSRAWSPAQQQWSFLCALLATMLACVSVLGWIFTSPDDPDGPHGDVTFADGVKYGPPALGAVALLSAMHFSIYLAIIGG
jgi:hypothetical protein